jgi:hypothetical protein
VFATGEFIVEPVFGKIQQATEGIEKMICKTHDILKFPQMSCGSHGTWGGQGGPPETIRTEQ